MNDGYVFAVSARNCTVGIFPTMNAALRAVRLTCHDTITKERTGSHAKVTGITQGMEIDFVVAAVKPTAQSSRLF